MAPKFPNPDPATDSVRDRLNQFIEVAGRAVYPPLAVAPSPSTPGQIWWDVSSTVKIRDEANATWASLSTTMGAVSFKEAQTLTSGEKAQALSNIGAQPAGSYQPAGGYVRYDAAQTLTSGEQTQFRANTGLQVPPTSSANWVIVPTAAGRRLIVSGSTTVTLDANPNAFVTFPAAFSGVPVAAVVSNGDTGATYAAGSAFGVTRANMINTGFELSVKNPSCPGQPVRVDYYAYGVAP